MDELCPLCLKMGANRKIKAIQLNFEEASWMCENEECPWPFFGHDKPVFFPRKIGEKWAYEWETYRRVNERIGSIPVSIELSLYTPPVTPSECTSTKDSVQSEIAKNTLEASNNTDIFSSNLSPRDSYAPRSTAKAGFSSHEKVGITKEFNSAEIVPLQYKNDSKNIDQVPSALPSIFDIDGDEFLTNKIRIKLDPDSGSPNQHERDTAILDMENSKAAIDSVDAALIKFPKSQIEKSQEIIKPIEHSIRVAKGVPKIRSITRTNIKLQRFVPVNIVKNEKSEKMEHPAIPTKQKSLENIADRLYSPTQHTTTITLDGIPPITLSYDLTDLGEKAGEIVSETHTPIPCEKRAAVLHDNDHDKDSSTEIPKEKPRQSIKRRTANNAKAFEKFSFSALRKVGKGLNIADAPSAIKSEPPKFEEIINHNQSCTYEGDYHFPLKGIVTSDTVSTTSNCGIVNPSQQVGTSNLMNLDANSSVVTESSAGDNLNLSCLIDDMLLDGYQNATQNLNDDWLQSFFNENA